MLPVDIDDQELLDISQLVRSRTGIRLGEAKRALIVARLGSRLRALGYDSFRQYYRHLCESDDGQELCRMINCLTTNKTAFFRERHHFDFIRERLISDLLARGQRKLRIWSAGCSTGQEPYSIAMLLAHDSRLQGWDIRILASDIDTDVLAHAEAGAYSAEEAESVPQPLDSSLEPSGTLVRVADGVRELVTFRRINLIDEPWPIRTQFDAIFCRNVTIYFDAETQAKIYRRFAAQLERYGYLFAGHSENLHWLKGVFTPVGGTVYCLSDTCGASGRPPRGTWRAPRHSRRPEAAARTASRESSTLRAGPLREVTLPAGGIHASALPSIARTVLGSCIAVCLFDPETKVGGMNHFMLPDGASDWPATRYGIHAINALVAALLERQAARSRLRAKVFGGARVLRLLGPGRSASEQNVEFVRGFLAEQKIPIVVERVGGEQPIYLKFETHTGRAFVRVIAASDPEASSIAPREARYRDALTRGVLSEHADEGRR
jgi:chemotaxis protein methyltransferase CheR